MYLTQYVLKDNSDLVPLNSITSYDNNILIDKLDLVLSGRYWRFSIPPLFYQLVDKQSISIFLESVYYHRFLYVKYQVGYDYFYIISRRRLRNYKVSLLIAGQLWGTQEVYNCRYYVQQHLKK